MQTPGGIVPHVWSGYDAAGVNCGSRDINFTPVAQASSSQTINQVAAAYRDTGNTQDFGGRMIQLAARISRISW